MKNYKLILIILGVVAALGITVFVYGKSVENKAIVLEESIAESNAAISKEEKRRVDLFTNLVDAVESYNDYEGSTLESIVEARKSAESGNLTDASETLSVVVEQYPELKSQENYQNIMQEFSITENRIADYRDSYNDFVKQYKRFVRKFPAKQFLSLNGYEQIEFDYLEFDVDDQATTNLFGK
ncbi:LemA family protein [Enterococcus sp. LJL90]